MGNCGIQGCRVNELTFFRVTSYLVHFAKDRTAFDTATCLESSETVGPVVAAVARIDFRGASEFRG